MLVYVHGMSSMIASVPNHGHHGQDKVRVTVFVRGFFWGMGGGGLFIFKSGKFENLFMVATIWLTALILEFK